MKGLNLKVIKILCIVLAVLLLANALAILIVKEEVEKFNETDYKLYLGVEDDEAGLTLEPIIGGGWNKEMPEDFEYPEEFDANSFKETNEAGKNISYGRTVEFQVTNITNIKINDWEMVIPINQDTLLNQAWSGEIEFSQFNGTKTATFKPISTIDASQYDIESMPCVELTVFPLQKGDTIIYHPTTDESPLEASDLVNEEYKSAKLGIIFYTSNEDIDFDGAYVIYHYGKELTDVTAFWALIGTLAALGLVLLGLLLILLVAERYTKIQNIANKKAEMELGEALRKAESANRSKTVFLNNMSHDIRTPMNAIVGFTELLEKNLDNKEKAVDYLEKIKTSNDFLLSLINNVLEMARIESGKTEVEKKACNFKQFIESIADVFMEQMNKKNIKFTNEINVEHKYLNIDDTKIREICLNIISNAYKYTLEGGSVDFSVEEIASSDTTVTNRIIVKDTGIGMSEEYVKTIFDEFSREKTSTEAKVTGTGLGMSIVKKLVDILGGGIEVKSKKGEGTTISIELTCDIATDFVEEVRTEDVVETERYKGKKLLLAEDNDLNAEIAISILEEAGFVVDRAVNGEECVNMIKSAEVGTYTLVLMDVQMPVMDGYEATKAIRAFEDKEKANIPIVAMTANAFSEDKAKAYEVGMNGHLTKPIILSELFTTLNKLVG